VSARYVPSLAFFLAALVAFTSCSQARDLPGTVVDAGAGAVDAEVAQGWEDAAPDGTPPVVLGDASTDSADDVTSADAALNRTGACGVCDRIWVCNGVAQEWKSEADGRCVNQVNQTALRCNGILDGRSLDLGTWRGDPRELELIFRNAPNSYFCYPP
jgi:hypothetical protein